MRILAGSASVLISISLILTVSGSWETILGDGPDAGQRRISPPGCV